MEETTDPQSQPRILVAEDDFVSRQVLCRYLASHGQCDVAADGQQALKAVQHALDEDRPYDVIFLDIMMPNMDGHTALRAIRHLEEEKAQAPMHRAKIVIATSMKDTENFMRAYAAHCDGYIVKPFSRTQIAEQLRNLNLP